MTLKPNHVRARWIVLVAAVYGIGVFRPSVALGQGNPMSASLARVLAETADGMRDNLPHWIVARARYPHRILGVYSTSDSAGQARIRTLADTALRRVWGGEDLQVFGPFVTPIDFERPYPGVIAWCMHLKSPIASSYTPPRRDSLYIPMDSALSRGPYCPERVFRAAAIRAIRMSIITDSDSMSFDVRNADAVFLTASAIQKFVLPYYTHVYGPAYASRLWDEIVRQVALLP